MRDETRGEAGRGRVGGSWIPWLCSLPVLVALGAALFWWDAKPSARGVVAVSSVQPGWLVRRAADGRESPFFLCAPGDPEGFLYRGRRLPDGTRDGDQMPLIEKLREHGGNAIYLIAARTHGGDEGKDDNPGPRGSENPFLGSDPARGLDPAILDQWEEWFTAMDDAGVVVFFIFYDDGTRFWDTGDEIGDAERAFIRELVGRFGHHESLMWMHAEEYEERYTPARSKAFAAEIRAADPLGHAIVQSQLGGLKFHFSGDDAFDVFGAQHNVDSIDESHDGMVEAWERAGGRHAVMLLENTRFGVGDVARQRFWAAAMGGAAAVTRVFADIVSTPPEELADCRRLRAFFEATDLPTMMPHDELAHGSTKWVLARPGASWIAYTPTADGPMGLRDVPAGPYRLRWFDPRSGVESIEEVELETRGDATWPVPGGIGPEVALSLRYVGERRNVAPDVYRMRLPVEPGGRLRVTPSALDLDGPQPLRFRVHTEPQHGSLTPAGEGGWDYEPEAGFEGVDRFEVVASDGADDSAPTAIFLEVSR